MQEILDLKDKREKKARGCLESVTCAGVGQGVMEMLKLFTQVCTTPSFHNSWEYNSRAKGPLKDVFKTNLQRK